MVNGHWSCKVLELYLTAKHNTSKLKKWGGGMVMVVQSYKWVCGVGVVVLDWLNTDGGSGA